MSKIIGNCKVLDKRIPWTQEFEDAKGAPINVETRDIGETVEFKDGSVYLKTWNPWIEFHPLISIIESGRSESCTPLHPDWEDYKAAHIVGNEEEWDEEGEWNVFCEDRKIA